MAGILQQVAYVVDSLNLLSQVPWLLTCAFTHSRDVP